MRPKLDRVTDCIAFAINSNAPPAAEWLRDMVDGKVGFASFSAGEAAELLIAAATTVFLGAATALSDEATKATVRSKLHQCLDDAITVVLKHPSDALAIVSTAAGMAVSAAHGELREERQRAVQGNKTKSSKAN